MKNTIEQLKAVNVEEFFAPNVVFCYGAGGAFLGIAPYLFACGINIVGVIDTYKRGWIDVADRRLPIYSMNGAYEVSNSIPDKGTASVVITIADSSLYENIEERLVAQGFSEERIFDLNFWTWLTVPSEKVFCKNIGHYMQFYPSGLSACCNLGVKDSYLAEWYIKGKKIIESVENYLEKIQYYIDEAEKGRVPLYCKECPFLLDAGVESVGNSINIDRFITSDHVVCNADCVYCTDACTMPHRKVGHTLDERFDGMIDARNLLLKRQLIANDSIIQLASGEISIIPQKRKLLQLIEGQPEFRVEIYTNCFIYDEDIEGILKKYKNAVLQCDLDAGTPETYIKVKGFNKFQTVLRNLEKYASMGKVRIKYVILPGMNDSEEDYVGMIRIIKRLSLDNILLSPEYEMSRKNNRFEKRSLCFSTAKFIVMLNKDGIQAVLIKDFWSDEDAALIKRFTRELTLEQDSAI